MFELMNIQWVTDISLKLNLSAPALGSGKHVIVRMMYDPFLLITLQGGLSSPRRIIEGLAVSLIG